MFDSHEDGLTLLIAWLLPSFEHDTAVTGALPAIAAADSLIETGFP